MADDLMRELAPFLAADGVDINDIPDIATLNRALQKATEQRNTALFTPVGNRRRRAKDLLVLAVAAITLDNTERAGKILDQAQPESKDDSVAEVSSCIGMALSLLDDWLGGQDAGAPANLAASVRLPAGHWFGERAAISIIALARKGRAFDSYGSLIVKQGSHQVLAGSALALAAAARTWSAASGTPIGQLVPKIIR
jgi:hypothetical protein